MRKIFGGMEDIPIIHPDSKVRYYWDFIILIATLYLAIEIPLSLVFVLPGSPALSIINTLVGIIYVADIGMRFNIGIDEQGRIITDRRKIASRYLHGWFPVDLLAAMPLGVFLSGTKLSSLSKLAKMLRFNRLLKLVRADTTIRNVAGRHANPAIVRLGLLVFWVLMAAHIISCGWIAIEGNPLDLSQRDQYIRAFYWTVTTLTTIGYGDITPQTNSQIVFVVMIEILGAGMYGLIIGNIANLISNIDITKAQYREKVERVNTFLKYRNIPLDVQKKINNYYSYLWESMRGYDESAVISDLPAPLRTQVALCLNQDIIEKVPIFEGAGQELLKDIVVNLKPVVFTPGDYIVTAGEVGDEMYFISKGSVDVVSEDGRTVYAMLTDGQFFGEMALVLSTPRTASIIARDYCDLYSLNKETFDRILEKYPEFGKTIKELAEGRRAEQEAAQVKRQESEKEPKNEVEHTRPEKVRGTHVERTARGVVLTWLDAQHDGHYEIIKKVPRAQHWSVVDNNVTETRYTDLAAKTDQTCMYRIRAVNIAGPGPWSETCYADRRPLRRR